MKKARFADYVLSGILLLQGFILEDTYGYWHSDVSIIYKEVLGWSLMTCLYVVLFFSQPIRLRMEIPIGTRFLAYALVLCISVALGYSVISGGLALGSGTGLLEIRVTAVMVLIYLALRNYLSYSSPERFINIVTIAASLSAIFHLTLYIAGADLMYSAVDQFGRSTAFEGGILMLWTTGFCFCLAAIVGKKKSWRDFVQMVILGLGILLSYRRFFILSMLGGGAVILFFTPSPTIWAAVKRRMTILAIFALFVAYIWVRAPEVMQRVAIDGMIDQNSEAFAKSYSSNTGHYSDILMGIALVKLHPYFGIGLGKPFEGGDGDAIVSSMLHSEHLHTWLRLGLLGILTLTLFYFILCYRVQYILRKSNNELRIRIALAVLAFTLPHYVLSFIGPPFYLMQKPQFLMVLFFVLLEDTYIREREDKLTIGKEKLEAPDPLLKTPAVL
jgi:hypothetical protein